MAKAIRSTELQFPYWSEKYSGKVRDVYNVSGKVLVIVATDRISAFDVILPNAIPFKGQVLNQTASYFMDATRDLVPNHIISTPDPNVTIGKKCNPFPIEMVVRGYLSGHAWRTYNAGLRTLCGCTFPEGLREDDRLPEPIITPSTKSKIGHDEDITEMEILKSGIVDRDEWERMKHYALTLFNKGTELAAARGLILADTKYEFGLDTDDNVTLIDEIHTPDSSRYFFLDGYEARQSAGEAQKQLSKEFVRKWLMENNFMGKEGQTVPVMPDLFVNEVSDRYIELYENVTGKSFLRADTTDIEARIQANVDAALKSIL